MHPFPSVLVALVTAALASIAGGSANEVVTLAAAMLCFQASIGITNDLADLDRDRREAARKPLPAGQIGVGAARLMALSAGIVSLALSASLGWAVLIVGAAGYACGIAYDLVLRTRGLAWMAYAAALPLLLAYAWVGGSGSLPASWPIVVPLAAALGPALHLSNSMVDVDRDVGDPAGGLAGRMGQDRAVRMLAVLLLAVYSLAWLRITAGALPTMAAPTGEWAWLVTATMITATILAVAGVALAARPARRSRSWGWTTEALASGLLAVSLLAAG